MDSSLQSLFVQLRKEYISLYFHKLNLEQRTAVLKTEGPLLLLAGAGSGKTTVLIHRIENLLRFGSGADSDYIPPYISEETVSLLRDCVNKKQFSAEADLACKLNTPYPSSILAITFTNKAANELKSRLEKQLGSEGLSVWAMTFHSACCRILRKEIDRLGYGTNFTIYDSADSEHLMKDILKECNLDEKVFPPKSILSYISHAKDEMLSPDDYASGAEESNDYRKRISAKCYRLYQNRLFSANAVDFDDLIFLTVQLLQEFPEVREYYQHKFHYVLVDEYQDTNHAQYLLTSLLAGGYGNICVVGDDDQSIYKFRGATIRNILDFEKNFPGAKIIRLEQNYRSSQNILNAANVVIANNRQRKGKKLWTNNESGDKILVYEAEDEKGEADFVAGDILSKHRENPFSAFAVLYRTNAQSNTLERSFTENAIPYRIIGGTRFFDRAEVKDIISYLTVIDNPNDDLRLKRIINTPARGIGGKTLEYAERIASSENISLFEAMVRAKDYPSLEKAAGKLKKFTDFIQEMQGYLAAENLVDFYAHVLEKTGYRAMLENRKTIEDSVRLENILELQSNIVSYLNSHEEPSLQGFLEEISLYTDLERYNSEEDSVVLMTIHSAKGLEFEHVYLIGAEEGLFPNGRSMDEPDEIEEERRLCYVAITRAKKSFTATHTERRLLYGHSSMNPPSRFLKELPSDCVDRREMRKTFRQCRDWSFNFDAALPYEQAHAYRKDNFGSKTAGAFSKTASGAILNSKPKEEYKTGNMVQHDAFGKGMVLSAIPMGSDALLEIAFDDFGTKKLLSNSASAHMIKL